MQITVPEVFNVDRVDGLFGIEIEVEGRELPRIPFKYWNTTQDGSLRGEDTAEYVLKKPLERPETMAALVELTRAMEAAGSTLAWSERCSTHVHVNCTNFTAVQLFNFITLLLLFEDTLVNWCGEARTGNLFCLKTRDAMGSILNIASYLKEHGMRHVGGDDIRYSAINLAALHKYGSVELRSLYGTVDKAVIHTWISVLENIHNAAMDYKNPIAVIHDLSFRGAEAFAKGIFKEHFDTFFTSSVNFAEVMEGARRSQIIAFSADWDTIFDKEIREEPKKKRAPRHFLEELGGIPPVVLGDPVFDARKARAEHLKRLADRILIHTRANIAEVMANPEMEEEDDEEDEE